jgi:NAD(P)-dependent dehydrogenase (short-subunit alcohol dehydrogenase family)
MEDPTARINLCVELLERFSEDPEAFAALPEESRHALLRAAGRFSRPDREQQTLRAKAIRKENRRQVVEKEQAARAATGIRSARQTEVFTAPKQLAAPDPSPGNERLLQSPRNCYICKDEFTRLHHFYDQLCPRCAEFNYAKRFPSADLTGQVALITGSRVKIGYQATLMLLRAGATVVATTRFPVDSALRFSKEEDYPAWSGRLHVCGLDLRHTPSVELFTRWFEQTWGRLDILINNAAQTVRRPPVFYAHLMANESLPPGEIPPGAARLLARYSDCVGQLTRGSADGSSPMISAGSSVPVSPDLVSWSGRSPGIGIQASARLSQIPWAAEDPAHNEELFPVGRLDADLQQVDLRTVNSWRLTLGDIPTAEMLELQLINAVAPFVLCNRLIPLMKRENTGIKHIINVTAMEGKFFRFKKDSRHPHTNMAKAALNMLTHTAAADLAKAGIWMNAVDTGWVTDEDPAVLAEKKQREHDFQPPLDIVDGAARVVDPLFDGIGTGKHWCGQFLKDYFPIDW